LNQAGEILESMNISAPLPIDLWQKSGHRSLRELDKPKALFILEEKTCDLIYSPQVRRDLGRLADFYLEPQSRESIQAHPERLRDVEIIFSGWGAPLMDQAFLDAAPQLRAVFYGAGSIGYFVTEEFWKRDILVTGASELNAQPVAEYTLAVILLSLKKFWSLSEAVRSGHGWGDHTRHVTGTFRAKVGLIACGMIARRVIELLKPFDIDCLVYDPFLSSEEASELGVCLCSLEDVFAKADVVSLHAPDKPETWGMITGRLFAMMKRDATFLNTARPRIIRQDELIEVLSGRPDLQVILDVCEPEPLPVNSGLLDYRNVIVTPHIAGSLGPECARLGEFMLEEFQRYLAGDPLQGRISYEQSLLLA